MLRPLLQELQMTVNTLDCLIKSLGAVTTCILASFGIPVIGFGQTFKVAEGNIASEKAQ